MSTEQKPLTPLTATEFHFAELRSYLSGFWQGREFLAEFDAREVTHAATREQLKEANEIIERVGQEADHFCKQADLLREQLAEAQAALAGEWSDLDNLPEHTPEQVAELNAEHAEWLRKRKDRVKAVFVAGAEAQRAEDAKRAERFDAWFDMKEPRGRILSEEILAAPLAEYVPAEGRNEKGGE